MHMSLTEFSLNLVLVPNVEVGLGRDDGLGILFRTRGGIVLDFHDGRSTSVHVLEGGRGGELGEKRG